jgi:hypothetical protein
MLCCAVQIVLLGDDTGCLHLYSLASDKLLATKQVSSSRINGIISCDSPGSSSSSSACGSTPGSSSTSSRGGTCVQFAVLSEDGAGLWQLRQGFSHGIVPGGHRQGVLVLQFWSSPQQVGATGCLVAYINMLLPWYQLHKNSSVGLHHLADCIRAPESVQGTLYVSVCSGY